MNEIWEIHITDGAEPITLEQAKEWLRVTSEDDDAVITSLITVARKKIERFTTRSLVAKDILLTGRFVKMFPLPYAPIVSVDEVLFLEGQNTDGTNDWETLDADDYQTVGYSEKHFRPLKSGVYEITYTTSADSDEGLLTDLKRVLLWMYENRGDLADTMPAELMSNSRHLRNLTWL